MSKKLPVFDAVLDGPETGVNEIAFVKDPAIMVKGVAFASQAPKQRIAAPILIPMNIYRYNENDGEYEVRFTAYEIEAIVQDFQQKSKTAAFNLEHNTGVIAPAYLLESWLVGENTQADRSYSEFGVEVPAGTWFGVSQVTDTNFYNELVANEQTGYSIEGLLGLAIKQNKQNKQNMSKQFKLAEVTTIDGYPLFIDGDLAIGTNVFVITPNGEKMVPDDGMLELSDGKTIEIEDGLISEISAPGEELEDAVEGESEPIEMAVSGDTATSGDTTSTPVEPAPTDAPAPIDTPAPADSMPMLTPEDVTKMIDEKVAELVAKIAQMQTVIDGLNAPASASAASTKMSEQKFSITERFFQFNNKI
jgi:hypothetical protein